MEKAVLYTHPKQADGQRYEGQWQNNEKNGQGTLHFVNGNRFSGGVKTTELAAKAPTFSPMEIIMSALGYAVSAMVMAPTPMLAAVRRQWSFVVDSESITKANFTGVLSCEAYNLS